MIFHGYDFLIISMIILMIVDGYIKRGGIHTNKRGGSLSIGRIKNGY